MNILVTGAKGQLGCAIRKRVERKGNGHADHFVGEKNHYIFVDIDELDITNEENVANFVKDNHINVIVNCAAYTNVEKAQKDRETAYDVNAKGPMELAFAAASVGAVLIHISTDYVFGGQRNTPVPPVSVGSDVRNFPDVDRDDCYYGFSKNIGEELIRQTGCKYIIVRTAWLYSEFGKNFVKTMAERAVYRKNTRVVFDQTGSPTNANDLAEFILHIIENNDAENRYLSKTGVYNFANKGVASWYDLARTVFSYFLDPCCVDDTISPCRSSEYPSDVIRPAYSVLDTEKTEKTFDYNIRYWVDALDSALPAISKELGERKEQEMQIFNAENTEYDYGHNVCSHECKSDI